MLECSSGEPATKAEIDKPVLKRPISRILAEIKAGRESAEAFIERCTPGEEERDIRVVV